MCTELHDACFRTLLLKRVSSLPIRHVAPVELQLGVLYSNKQQGCNIHYDRYCIILYLVHTKGWNRAAHMYSIHMLLHTTSAVCYIHYDWYCYLVHIKGWNRAAHICYCIQPVQCATFTMIGIVYLAYMKGWNRAAHSIDVLLHTIGVQHSLLWHT